MGGGLALLNKKPWHPGSFRNLEVIFKRNKTYQDKKNGDIILKRKRIIEHNSSELFRKNANIYSTKNEHVLSWMYIHEKLRFPTNRGNFCQRTVTVKKHSTDDNIEIKAPIIKNIQPYGDRDL